MNCILRMSFYITVKTLVNMRVSRYIFTCMIYVLSLATCIYVKIYMRLHIYIALKCIQCIIQCMYIYVTIAE